MTIVLQMKKKIFFWIFHSTLVDILSNTSNPEGKMFETYVLK